MRAAACAQTASDERVAGLNGTDVDPSWLKRWSGFSRAGQGSRIVTPQEKPSQAEVDGGSNRGAYQGGDVGLADGDAGQASLKAKEEVTGDCREKPHQKWLIGMQ